MGEGSRSSCPTGWLAGLVGAALWVSSSGPAGQESGEQGDAEGGARRELTTREADERPARATVEVEIRITAGAGKDARPIPGLEYELVLARAPAEGQSFPRPPVAFEELEHLGEPVRGTTGEDGRGAHRLSYPVDEATPLAWLVVRSPGYQQRTSTGTPKDGRVELRVAAWRGSTVRGRVVSVEGTDVAHASVFLFSQDENRPVDRSTAVDGRFELHAGEAPPSRVLARANGLGSAQLAGPELAAALEEGERITLRLSGGASIAGRVLDARGEPVRRLTVTARPVGDDDSNRITRPWSERGEGTLDGSTLTGDDGRFRLEGLVPGAYRLGGHLAYGMDTEVLAVEVATGTEDLVLRYANPRLEVALVDEAGRPFEAVLGPWSKRDRREHAPWLFVYALEPDGSIKNPGWTDLDVSYFVPPNVAGFSVSPDTDYVVGVVDVHGTGRPVVLERLAVPAGTTLVERELVLGEERAPARLTVQATFEGKPYLEKLEVVAATREYGVPVDTWEQDVRPWPGQEGAGRTEFLLPAGRYRIRAEPKEKRGHHGELHRVAYHCPAEAVLELRAGEERELELAVAGSGRLELEVHVRDLPMHTRLPVRLVPAVLAPPIEPTFLLFERPVTGEGQYVQSGKPYPTVTPIPTGDYEVEVDLPDGRTLKERATIEYRKTTRLRIDA